MNRQVIIDSNIVIYAALPQHIELREWLKFTNIFTSAISEIEVLGFSKLTPGDKIYFEEFFSTCTIISIKEKHIRKAIELRQEKTMSLGDSIIAASAINEDLPLVTANIQDFRHIANIHLINLQDL